MIVYPSMLVPHAKEAGIDVPDPVGDLAQVRETHLRFYIYCMMQLEVPVPYAGALTDNARVIAGLKEEELSTITDVEIYKRGFVVGDSSLYN